MYSFLYLTLILHLKFFNVLSSVLNIEELNSIHYSIDIVNNPVLKTQEWTTDIVTVTNKHGQEYICTLPKVQIPENENKKEEDLLDQLVDISELLKPMEAAPCLIKKKDWWSYEFCYGSVIKQYHLEDNKVVGTILILGKYESEYNWRNNSKSKNKLQKFHTQNYVNGTRCDITGEPRRAEVRFHCEEGVGDYIQQVDEPESCRYVIIIATTRVCHHPYLRPNPNRTPHNINCAPALNQDEFEHYQKLQEIKKTKMEREHLRLEEETKKSGSELDQTGDLVNAVGDNDTDEESKWSIRLVTIPISKKTRTSKNSVQSEVHKVISDQSGVEDIGLDDTDPNDSVSRISESAYEDLIEAESTNTAESEGLGTAKSYLNENELLEKEFGKIVNDLTEEKTEDEEKAGEEEVKESTKEQEERLKSVEKQFEAFRNRMEKLMRKWMEIQNEDHIQELLEKIKYNLNENVEQLQETANKYSEDSLSTYLNDLVDMAEKYKKKLPKTEDLDFDDEQKLMDALHSLTEILTEAELEVLKAVHKKKKLDRLEKYLETHLKQTEGNLSPVEDENPPVAEAEGVATPNDGIPDTSSFSAPPKSTPNPSKRFEDPIDPDGEEDRNAEKDKNAGTDETKGDTRHVRILNEKNLDEDRKTKLEQSIKERLQKSGLDNIGRKIEVKILTPNYLDDDEKDSLSSLSQEETEAFHNMIVNILSASAEELKEKERHKNLESNYNFHLEDSDTDTEEIQPSDGEEQEVRDTASFETTEDNDNNNNELN